MVNGIDVSAYQPNVDFRSGARRRLLVRRTSRRRESTNYTSVGFARASGRDAAAAGMLRGGYHFFDFNADPGEQARYFLSVCPPTKGALPPMLDLETTDGVPPAAQNVAAVATFLNAVQAATGVRCVLYVNDGCWSGTLGATSDFSGHPFWAPSYLEGVSVAAAAQQHAADPAASAAADHRVGALDVLAVQPDRHRSPGSTAASTSTCSTARSPSCKRSARSSAAPALAELLGDPREELAHRRVQVRHLGDLARGRAAVDQRDRLAGEIDRVVGDDRDARRRGRRRARASIFTKPSASPETSALPTSPPGSVATRTVDPARAALRAR